MVRLQSKNTFYFKTVGRKYKPLEIGIHFQIPFFTNTWNLVQCWDHVQQVIPVDRSLIMVRRSHALRICKPRQNLQDFFSYSKCYTFSTSSNEQLLQKNPWRVTSGCRPVERNRELPPHPTPHPRRRKRPLLKNAKKQQLLNRYSFF